MQLANIYGVGYLAKLGTQTVKQILESSLVSALHIVSIPDPLTPYVEDGL